MQYELCMLQLKIRKKQETEMREIIFQGKYHVWLINSNRKRYLHMNLVSKSRNYDAYENS